MVRPAAVPTTGTMPTTPLKNSKKALPYSPLLTLSAANAVPEQQKLMVFF